MSSTGLFPTIAEMVIGVGAVVAVILAAARLFFGGSGWNKDLFHADLDVCQAERERIARDLHDTLLQGTQALLFRLQTWEDYPGVPESLRNEIARVVGQTRSIVVESRECILRIRQTAPADLPEALAAIGREHDISAEKGVTFDLSVTGEARSLNLDAKEQLIHIAREAVHNAYQHAGAGHISVSLQYRRLSLLMSIADDGRGIDPALAQGASISGHLGLIGIRERSAHLGGRLRIYSRPGRGTRVEVAVPAGMAFRDAVRWPWRHKGASLVLAR